MVPARARLRTASERKAIADEVRARRRRRVAGFLDDERDWRLYPGDGGDPTEVSPEVLAREVAFEEEARARASRRAPDGDEGAYRARSRRSGSA